MAKRTDLPDAGRPRAPRARKRFGQHFLEPAWVSRLVRSLDASPSDTFLEIGPGRGALTIPLAAQVGRLIAVEIDRDLAAALPSRLPPHARVVTDDFLNIEMAELLAGEQTPVRVVGNLPYNVSSPILFALLAASQAGVVFSDATVMLQREVAERIAAHPGRRAYGALAIQVAAGADVEHLLDLPPGAFRPPPKVWSSVVRLTFRPSPFEIHSPEVFARIVRGVFLQRRKTLTNALTPVASTLGANAVDLIDRAGLDGSKRPEQLSPSDFGRLAAAVL